MAWEEKRAGWIGEEFFGGLGDAEFRAAGVGDECMARGGTREVRQQVQGHANGQREEDQVGGTNGWGEISAKHFVEGAAGLGRAGYVGAVPAGDVKIGGIFAQGEGEGSPDQARAENRNAMDKVCGHRQGRSGDAAANGWG